jgi:hypothetical protein
VSSLLAGSRRALFRFGLPAARLVFLGLGALVRFGLHAARQYFLALGALIRFGSPAARRFFFFLARGALFGFAWLSYGASFLDRGALFRFGYLRFVFFLRSRRSRFCLLFLGGSWRVCVCVFVPSLARALAYSARALSPCSAVALVSRRKERV